jgi:TPR repeat protein
MTNPNEPIPERRDRDTQPIPILPDLDEAPDPQRTAALALRQPEPPGPTDSQKRAIQAQMSAADALRQARPAPAKSHTLAYWAGGVVAVLILAYAAASYLLNRPLLPVPGAAAPAQAQEPPPPLRAYYDRAQEGDVNAMRMLGTMYYNGLNVPQDQKEGVRWYRKAAAAGSVAARKDLEQLGISPTP